MLSPAVRVAPMILLLGIQALDSRTLLRGIVYGGLFGVQLCGLILGKRKRVTASSQILLLYALPSLIFLIVVLFFSHTFAQRAFWVPFGALQLWVLACFNDGYVKIEPTGLLVKWGSRRFTIPFAEISHVGPYRPALVDRLVPLGPPTPTVAIQTRPRASHIWFPWPHAAHLNILREQVGPFLSDLSHGRSEEG